MLFRVVAHCRAGENIGMGHAVRLGALLNEFPEDIEIICCHDNPLIRSYFPSNTTFISANTDVIKDELIKTSFPSVFIVDLPKYKSEFWPPACANILTIAIDDYSMTSVTADIVIDASDLSGEHSYPELSAHAVVLRGLSYLLMRSVFKFFPTVPKKRTGVGFVIGSGKLSMKWAKNIVESLDVEGLGDVHIVVSRNQPEIKKLQEIGRMRGLTVQTHLTGEQMYQHYKNLRLCVMTGGSASFEAMATGTPVLSYPIMENMVNEVKTLASLGCLELLKHEQAEPVILRTVIDDLLADTAYLDNLSETAKKTIDGQGTTRISRFIEKIMMNMKSGESKEESIRLEFENNVEF